MLHKQGEKHYVHFKDLALFHLILFSLVDSIIKFLWITNTKKIMFLTKKIQQNITFQKIGGLYFLTPFSFFT